MKTRTEIQERISALRQIMKGKGLAAFIVPSTDPHAGEYVPEHWESRKWISGFTGSAGTVAGAAILFVGSLGCAGLALRKNKKDGE